MGCARNCCATVATAVVLCCAVALGGQEAQSRSWRPILPSVGGNYDSRHGLPALPESSLTESYIQPYEPQPSEYDFGPPQVPQHFQNEGGDQCTVYKVSFNQELYFQYIQYKIGIPDMKEFTLCMWTKFVNHSNDHPLFSYSTPDQPRAIYSWVSNTNRASYFSMAVEGHTFFRLNYPLRLNRWYHSCQSWNSRTGEWQLWVNAERVGRGFHNRLVGHMIPGNGIAITGQEQRQHGGGFLEGIHGPRGAGGMLGEVTMLHLYAAALAPGKAHKDHKHHHGQHNHAAATPPPPPAGPPTPAPPPTFLVGNQLPGALILNLGNLQGQNKLPLPLPPLLPTPSPTLHPLNPQNGINSLNRLNPLNPSLLYNQNLSPNINPLSSLNQQFNTIRYGNQGFGPIAPGLKLTGQDGDLIQQTFHGNGGGLNIGQGGFNDGNYLGGRGNYGQRLFKRQPAKDAKIDDVEAKNITKRSADAEKVLEKEVEKSSDDDEHKHAKRGIFGPDPYSSGFLSLGGYSGGGGGGGGGQGANYLQPTTLLDIENTQNALQGGGGGGGGGGGFLAGGGSQGQPTSESYPREPAEGEVLKIMNVCTGCDPEPYKRAEIISWRNTPKKLYSGALYIPAKPQCRRF